MIMLPCSLRGSRLGSEAAVGAGVVDQGAAGRWVRGGFVGGGAGFIGGGDGFDLADDDAVVAGVVHRGGAALQDGQRVVEQRRAGGRAGVVGHAVQLAVERAAAQRQPAGGLLVVLGQDRHRPGALGQDRVVEPGDLLGAEQDERRVERHRGERADRHGVPAPGGDHHDPARELARGPPEGGLIHGHRGRIPPPRTPAPRTQAPKDRAIPASALTVPPYRYHLPAAVLVMITLPLATGMDRTNDARIQPSAGHSAPLTERMAQAPSRPVTKSTRQNTMAPRGAFRLYWKLPIRPSTAPTRNNEA